MQYPIIDLITDAYLNNGWTGLDIPQTITYEPIQLGSGDPSPDNIRPILPAATLNIGSVDVPVYGGTLDINSKILTVNIDVVNANTITWTDGIVSDVYCYYTVNGISKNQGQQDIYCSHFKPIVSQYFNPWPNQTLTNAWARYYNIIVRYDELENLTEWTDFINNNDVQIGWHISPVTYQLTADELDSVIGIKDDIAHRLKLPLPHYFPHPVIDALQRAAAGTQTAEDTEILQHYLTPLGIGGI